MNPKQIELADGERIIAVVPETCSGPGWINSVVWVHIADKAGKLRTEAIQPNEQTPQLRTLFKVGEAMCWTLLHAVPRTFPVYPETHTPTEAK